LYVVEQQHYGFLVGEEDSGERIDVYLAELIPELSRSRIQKALRSGEVLAGGSAISKASRKVHEGEWVELRLMPPKPLEIRPQAIPIEVVYEDDDLIVVNKPAGMVVHPAPGHPDGTLVNALLHHCKNLSGIGGVLRPGIVHRLDRGTSGLLAAAKNDRVHTALSRQIMDRKVGRVYRALVWGGMPQPSGVLSFPIGRSKRNRKKMAVVSTGGRESVTSYYMLDTFGPFGYIMLRLGTGRTHQIRVHLSHAGHPVFGDPEYGGRRIRKDSLSRVESEAAAKALSCIERQALHASELAFIHPSTGHEMTFSTELPPDFQAALDIVRGL
jgi:23S rRNA pseudouridine1911/1915/1917 synthase